MELQVLSCRLEVLPPLPFILFVYFVVPTNNEQPATNNPSPVAFQPKPYNQSDRIVASTRYYPIEASKIMIKNKSKAIPI